MRRRVEGMCTKWETGYCSLQSTLPCAASPGRQFKVVAVHGINNVELECHDRFHYIDPVVNIEQLRPYKCRDVAHLSNVTPVAPGPIVDDPRGGSW